jgi:chemotaxis signal transduction protein
MTQAAPASSHHGASHLPAKLEQIRRACLFTLGEYTFVTDGVFNRQFVRVDKLTPVPRGPQALLGLFAVRSQVRPLYRLERLLGLTEVLDRSRTETAALFEVAGTTFGVMVSAVLGFPNFNTDTFLPLNASHPVGLNGLVLGTIVIEGKSALILDLEALLARIQQVQTPAPFQPELAGLEVPGHEVPGHELAGLEVPGLA